MHAYSSVPVLSEMLGGGGWGYATCIVTGSLCCLYCGMGPMTSVLRGGDRGAEIPASPPFYS